MSVWINKCVKIDTTSGYYYKGIVLSTDGNSILLKDIKENNVMLKIDNIILIREVSNGN